MSAPKVTVSTDVLLAPGRAWAAYTDADAITRWNFASDDWYCPTASIDLRVGGTHRARMEARDGSFGFDFEGVYQEVAPAAALTIVLADGRVSRTTFDAIAGGTRVTITFDAEAGNPVEMQRGGWQAMLDNYRRYAEQVADGNTG